MSHSEVFQSLAKFTILMPERPQHLMGGKRGLGDSLADSLQRQLDGKCRYFGRYVVNGLRQDGSAVTQRRLYTVPSRKGLISRLRYLDGCLPLKSHVWACHGTVGRAVHHRRCRERSEIRGYIVGNADLQQLCGLVERANLQQAEMAAGAI